MRHLLLAALVCAAPLATAQAQTTLYPGQSGTSLLSSVRSGYTPTQTLGYGPARDALYAYEDQSPEGLCGVYTQFCISLAPGADPSSDAYQKGINAEHTWPQSLGAGSEPARSDMHHLFPSKANVNSARGSDPLVEIADASATMWYRGGSQQSATPGSNLAEWSEDGAGAFEPRHDHKGDAARAVFYFRAIYDGVLSSSGRAFFDAMADDLIVWHYADPVSAEEAARSAWIAGQQGRENPFVLDSTLARRAYNLSAPSGGGGTGSGGDLWVNELHYDDSGTDQNEGVELAGPAGTSLSGWTLAFYNGNGGSVYKTVALSGSVPSQQGGFGTIWVAVSGVQNGAPDGVALVAPDGAVAEFLSYEGALTASSGPAAGLTAADIGVSESSGTAAGQSLQRTGTGGAGADFAWAGPSSHSRGAPNAGQTFSGSGGGGSSAPVAWVNELHYDNKGSDQNEGVEIAGTAGLSLSGWSVAFYNGNGGSVYRTTALSGTLDDEGAGLGARWFGTSGIQNGAPDGLALVDADGAVVQFLSYEGTFTASSGPAAGLTSQDIGRSETSGTPKGRSLQLAGTGSVYADFSWAAAASHTRGSRNGAQTFAAPRQGAPLAAAPAAVSEATVAPNPTRGRATLALRVDTAVPVRAELFDVRGRRVATVWDGELATGTHALPLDASTLPAGVYVVRVQAGAAVTTHRITVVR